MSKGFEKLKAAVERDCNDEYNGLKCFNADGCNVQYCDRQGKCTHEPCSKFKWIISRAKEYAQALNLNWEDVLDSWEEDRDYWYQNYYQECNQPNIKADKVKVFDTVEDMLASVGKLEFRCPVCGGISTDPYVCNSGLEMSKGKICDWKVYGLFKDLGKGVFVYCKDKLKGQTIFMPLAWESEFTVAEVSQKHQ